MDLSPSDVLFGADATELEGMDLGSDDDAEGASDSVSESGGGSRSLAGSKADATDTSEAGGVCCAALKDQEQEAGDMLIDVSDFENEGERIAEDVFVIGQNAGGLLDEDVGRGSNISAQAAMLIAHVFMQMRKLPRALAWQVAQALAPEQAFPSNGLQASLLASHVLGVSQRLPRRLFELAGKSGIRIRTPGIKRMARRLRGHILAPKRFAFESAKRCLQHIGESQTLVTVGTWRACARLA